MTPFFFGTNARRLFGLYTPGNARTQRAVVLCHPWGQEYLRAHRSIRHLATLLNRAGVHVLRFDYFGTGDSAGEMTDADLKGWQSDIDTAIDELKDTTGATRVGLVGLRLGGTLAARVAAKRKADIDKVVLWDPVMKGTEFLEEVRTLERAIATELDKVGNAKSVTTNGVERLLGFDLTAQMAKDIAAVELGTALSTVTVPTLVVATQPSSGHDGLRASTKASVVVEEIVSEAPWLEIKGVGVGAIPIKVLQRIVEWLS